jgi:peptidoglycan/LPS O-acetylase OafA/YrhL
VPRDLATSRDAASSGGKGDDDAGEDADANGAAHTGTGTAVDTVDTAGEAADDVPVIRIGFDEEPPAPEPRPEDEPGTLRRRSRAPAPDTGRDRRRRRNGGLRRPDAGPGTATGTAVAATGGDPPEERRRRPRAGTPARWADRVATARMGYQPALDGMRALAVLLVIGYHVGYSRLAGGYIGVEVFFVLSGWLVCALLVGEHRATGGVAMRHFWVRRARRLLPAMVVVTVATLAVATVAMPERVADLRSDGLAALTYHLNWRLILDHRSYFATADGPSALNHLWSLSIEEQFYLVFPLLALFLARRRPGLAVLLALGGAAASTALRLAWTGPTVDPSRAYFGTDTRAAGLLAGVALGLFWVPNRLRWRGGRGLVVGLDVVALASLAVIGWYATMLSEQDLAAFGSAFTLVQVATLGLIAVVVHPAPTLSRRLLGLEALVWVGRRSYGIYLIHWPVIVFTSEAPGQQPERPLRVAAQLIVIGVLAAASYAWVEQPIRRLGMAGAWRRGRARVGALLGGRPALTTVALAGTVLLVGGTAAVASDVVTATDTAAPATESVVIGGTEAGAPAGPGTGTGGARDNAAAGDGGSPTTARDTPAAEPVPARPAGVPPESAAAVPTPAPAGTEYPPTFALGDSVMAGGADVLAARMGPALSLDAAVGRQLNESAALLRAAADEGRLAQVVVLHLGNNGPFDAAEIDELFAAIGPDRRVVLVTVFVPRRWEGEVNDALRAAAARHPNAVLADWRAVAVGEPGLLSEDGYHLNPQGAQRYADVVTDAIRG